MRFSDKTMPIKDRLRECAEPDAAEGCELSVISMMEEAANEIDSLLALAKLGRWVLDMREESDCDDLYAEDIQNKAGDLGLLEEVMATASCGDKCLCVEFNDFPQPKKVGTNPGTQNQGEKPDLTSERKADVQDTKYLN